MITFCLILLTFAVLVCIAAGGIVALAAMFSGAFLVVLDVIIGIAPFVGVFLLIKWLAKKR